MSRQQTRSSGDGAIDPSLVQKKRARHRLVGAVCLCLLAAAVVPLVLESEPRPRERELPIELAPPERREGLPPPAGGDAAPLPAAGPAAAQSAVKTVVPPTAANDTTTGATRPDARLPTTGDVGRADKSEAAKVEAARAEAARQQAARQDPSKPGTTRHDPAGQDAARQDLAKQDAAKQEAARREAARQEAARQEAAKANGGKTSPPQDKTAARGDEAEVVARPTDRNAAAGAGAVASRRFLVQIGAYSNVQSARSMFDRVVGAGLRPYQETVKTAQGDWIRVRVGPFTTRQDAERAQQDLKRAGVTAAIIAL